GGEQGHLFPAQLLLLDLRFGLALELAEPAVDIRLDAAASPGAEEENDEFDIREALVLVVVEELPGAHRAGGLLADPRLAVGEGEFADLDAVLLGTERGGGAEQQGGGEKGEGGFHG